MVSTRSRVTSVVKRGIRQMCVLPRSLKKPSANNVDESYAVSHTVINGVCHNAKISTANRAWLLDSGCTAHLCGDQECFKSMSESSNIKLILASQASTQVKGSECAEAAVQYGCSELLKWHARLGHLNVKDLM
ncbi:Protein of unknown function, partial [Cotesia congregata]